MVFNPATATMERSSIDRIKTMEECSYCSRPAKWMGDYLNEDETDGDVYCDQHKNLAPGSLLPIED